MLPFQFITSTQVFALKKRQRGSMKTYATITACLKAEQQPKTGRFDTRNLHWPACLHWHALIQNCQRPLSAEAAYLLNNNNNNIYSGSSAHQSDFQGGPAVMR